MKYSTVKTNNAGINWKDSYERDKLELVPVGKYKKGKFPRRVNQIGF